MQLAKDWEINIWCQNISTSTKSDSNSTDSWFPSIQFFCPSLLYICLTNQYFELDEIFVIVSFTMQLELFWALLVNFCILRFYYCGVSNFPTSFYFGHKLKLSIQPKSILPSTTLNPSHPSWLIAKTSTAHLQYFVFSLPCWHASLPPTALWRNTALWPWRLGTGTPDTLQNVGCSC